MLYKVSQEFGAIREQGYKLFSSADDAELYAEKMRKRIAIMVSKWPAEIPKNVYDSQENEIWMKAIEMAGIGATNYGLSAASYIADHCVCIEKI